MGSLKEVTDLVYVVGPGRTHEELRYSLRSVCGNLPHDRVWIAGTAPSWLAGAEVIPTPDVGTKWQRIVAALETVLPHVGTDVVYLDDDLFVMEPMDGVPVWHRGLLEDQRGYAKGTGHSKGIRQTEVLLDRLGVQRPYLSYELHVPAPWNRDRMIECLTLARGFQGVLHYRTLYGNYWGVGGEAHDDVKVYGKGGDLHRPFLSTSNSSFANELVGRLIRERFCEPSRYERG